jgi:hypothetical protein
MWHFKQDIEAHVQYLDRYVEDLFVRELYAAGFEKRGGTWRKWRDYRPASAPTNGVTAAAILEQAPQAEALIVQKLRQCIHWEAVARVDLEAHPEWWPDSLEIAQAVQCNLIRYLGRCFRHNDLEDMYLDYARCMRQDQGAVTRLEKLLVEFMIVAWLYSEKRTDAKLKDVPEDAQRRMKRAAEMLDTARRLLGSQVDGTLVTHAPKMPEATNNVTNANVVEHGSREADPPAANREELATSVPAVRESTPATNGAGVPCHVKEAA